MLLENKYYKVIRVEREEMSAVFHLAILPDCEVYRGHFPGKPVCPGVCNIETIKECAMMLTGKEMIIRTIKQCRLTAVATPDACPEVMVSLSAQPIEGGFTVTARITDAAGKVYMEYKGDMNL